MNMAIIVAMIMLSIVTGAGGYMIAMDIYNRRLRDAEDRLNEQLREVRKRVQEIHQSQMEIKDEVSSAVTPDDLARVYEKIRNIVPSS